MRNELLFPHDRLSVIGSDEQIARFQGRTIKDSGIREETHGLVVGIERGNDRVLNPDSTQTIEPGDRLWVVGDQDLIERLSDAT